MDSPSHPPPPCPVCFEADATKAQYISVQNHSWMNRDRCDTHDICCSCLQQYVETKIFDDGIWHIRCPGPGCRYHLVDADVRAALHQSARGEEALQLREQLRSQRCGARLEEAVAAAGSDPREAWLLRECQACPRCFVLARREDGCLHLVCRCGCHYCYSCGAPYELGPGEQRGCLCDRDGGTPHRGLWLFREKRHPGLVHGRCEAVMLAEFDRREAERLEAERLEAERLEAERLEAERLEAERLEAERRELWELELAHGVSRSMLRGVLVGITPQGLDWRVAPSAPTIPELGWPAWAMEEYGEDWWVVGRKIEPPDDFVAWGRQKKCAAARPEPAASGAGQPCTGSHRRGFRQQKLRKVKRGKVLL